MMAPSPVFNSELKGPDKNTSKRAEFLNKDRRCSDVRQTNSKKATFSTVDQLDDSDLHNLLEEAFNYRNPKDLHGKSDLFKQLLESSVDPADELSSYHRPSADIADSSTAIIGNGHSRGSGDTAAEARSHGIPDTGGGGSGSGTGSSSNGGKKKQQRKAAKQMSSTTNGRKSKFSHSMNFNHGPVSSQIYNGTSSQHNGTIPRTTFIGRSYHTGATTTVVSCGNSISLCGGIPSLPDEPSVTMSNMLPIMSSAIATRAIAEDTSVGDEEGEVIAIEMKTMRRESARNVLHYTTHASLNINEEHSTAGEDSSDEGGITLEYPFRDKSALTNGAKAEDSESCQMLQYGPFKFDLENSETEHMDTSSYNDEEKRKTQKIRDTNGKRPEQRRRPSPQRKRHVTCRPVAVAEEAPRSLAGVIRMNQSATTAFKSYTEEMTYNIPWNTPEFAVFTMPSVLDEFGNSKRTDSRSYNSIRNLYPPESAEKKPEEPNVMSSLDYGECTAALNKDYDMDSKEKEKEDATKGKSKRKMKRKDSPSVLSESIEGYCGNKSITDLIQYIENSKPSSATAAPPAGKRTKPQPSPQSQPKLKLEKVRGKAATDDDMVRPKKNTTRPKDRLKKATSLEDLRLSSSKNKPKNKKQSSVDDDVYDEQPVAGYMRLYDDDSASTMVAAAAALYLDDERFIEPEFHLVKKKQRRRKNRSKSPRETERYERQIDSIAQCTSSNVITKSTIEPSADFLPHHYTDKNDDYDYRMSSDRKEKRNRSRRKSISSANPSDKVSDTDSIHSLPISSTTAKCKMKKKSTSGGCTPPNTSYAEMAKSPQCGAEDEWPSCAALAPASILVSTVTTPAAAVLPIINDDDDIAALDDDTIDVPANLPAEVSDVVNRAVYGVHVTLKRKTGGTTDKVDLVAAEMTRVCAEKAPNEDDMFIEFTVRCKATRTVNAAPTPAPDVSVERTVVVRPRRSLDEVVTVDGGVDELTVGFTFDERCGDVGANMVSCPAVKQIKSESTTEISNDNVKEPAVDVCNLQQTSIDHVAYAHKDNKPAEFISKVEDARKVQAEKKSHNIDSRLRKVNEEDTRRRKRNEDETRHRKVSDEGVKSNKHEEETQRRKSNEEEGRRKKSNEEDIRLRRIRDEKRANEEEQWRKVEEEARNRKLKDEKRAYREETRHKMPCEKLNEEETRLQTTLSKEEFDLYQRTMDQSSKYNVAEVIHYINKNWLEVMKSLNSRKVSDTNKKIQYYSGVKR